MNAAKADAEARFWKKVDTTPAGCWLWTAQRNWKGYGVFWFQRRKVKAHRFAYANAYGQIPPGLTVDHLCRNRACVNPAHLELVTNRENLMRGNGWGARNAVKTACKRGHELTPENTYVRPDGRGRECRACHRIWTKNHRKAEGRVAARPSNAESMTPTRRTEASDAWATYYSP